MRIQLTLNRTTRQRMLPMNYQSHVQAWIYKVLHNADAEFSNFLHNQGYGDEHKAYKLFCFNRLNIGKPRLWKEKELFEVSTNLLYLDVSFYLPEIATNFIKGLFIDQEVFLGDRFNGLDLQVGEVRVMDAPEYSETMRYKLHSPWVISVKKEGQRYPTYIKPDYEDFKYYSKKHLVEKWNTLNPSELIDIDQIDFCPKETYRRKGFRLKTGGRSETQVVGNVFDFSLTAPIGIHELINGAGCSEKSSFGFGWTEVLEM